MTSQELTPTSPTSLDDTSVEGMTAVTAAGVDPEVGLTTQQVRDRLSTGQVNTLPTGPSRTVKDIVKANVLTRFNFLLGALLIVILFVAPLEDALFGVVFIVNSAIGIIQELRAKKTLDRLKLLNEPKATVIRDGRARALEIEGIVRDDLLAVRTGEQIVVDGVVVGTEGLEVDESLLTGESDPVVKSVGSKVLSGSFVVAGSGKLQATKIGVESYSARLAADAKQFTLAHSDLRAGIDWLLRVISWVLVPAGAALLWGQLNADIELSEALRGTVAGLVGMIPQGLVLLTSVAFAVGVIRLGRRRALVQELQAVEALARVDVVCFDKTGTITEGSLEVVELQPIRAGFDAKAVLGALAANDTSPNATTAALARAYPDPEWKVLSAVPFSSARKWSGADFVGEGSWVLGAPEVLAGGDREVLERANAAARMGRRVLVVAETRGPVRAESLPIDVRPVALVELADRVRADAAATLEFFEQQGVAVKVISGDNPRTVAAVAAEAGVDGADKVIDAATLPEEPGPFATAVEQNVVFGRVSPRQKRRMVKALQSRGHVVAMTGDGVNDVLALKEADIGVAMGKGSPATRAVAQVVLLDSAFSTMPSLMAEGRRVLANIERVANLFVTKTVYAVFLALAVGIAAAPFPFLPRHLTLVGFLTIGAPGLFLALEPAWEPYRQGFLVRVLRFAIPAGALIALSTFLGYGLARAEDVDLVSSRTIATLMLVAIGLFILTVVSRPLNRAHRLLIGGMAFLFALVILLPGVRAFFELDLPRAVVVFAGLGIVSLTGLVMWLTLRVSGWLKEAPGRLRSDEINVLQGVRSLSNRQGWYDFLGWTTPDVPERSEQTQRVDAGQLELPLEED